MARLDRPPDRGGTPGSAPEVRPNSRKHSSRELRPSRTPLSESACAYPVPAEPRASALKQANYFHGHSVRVAAADGVPPRPRLAGCTPEGGEGGDGCLGIGPLVWSLAKLAPRNRGTRQSVPPVSAQGANQSPTSHVAHRLADARGSAGTGYGQALSGNGVRDGGSSREDACANLVGPSGACCESARIRPPCITWRSTLRKFVVVYRHHIVNFFIRRRRDD